MGSGAGCSKGGSSSSAAGYKTDKMDRRNQDGNYVRGKSTASPEGHCSKAGSIHGEDDAVAVDAAADNIRSGLASRAVEEEVALPGAKNDGAATADHNSVVRPSVDTCNRRCARPDCSYQSNCSSTALTTYPHMTPSLIPRVA